MRTIKLLALFLIIGTALAVTSVTPNTGLCTCSQIQYQADCQGVSIPNTNASLAPTVCTWTANPNATGTQAKGTCATATTTTPTTTPVATYCSNISVTACPSTVGCALPDGKTCQAFTGCPAYVFTTNSACQAVSTQCTTDGTQCAVKQPCSAYSATIANCGLYSSNSGTGTCKVSGTSCVDQTCTDAPVTLTTDTACNTFLSGCVSSGAGCIAAHVSCATQTGTATTCPTFIGLVPSEGLCKYSGTGTACAARTCADAPTTLTTNAQCIAFLPSCLYTIGKGCVSSTQSCSQLTFSLGCSSLVNTSGVACTNNTSANPATACREITCADNTTATTDAACNVNGLTGCVTNGAGCVASGSNQCTSYNGTNSQCATYNGSNGPCKGAAANSTTSQACVAKTCSDAPSTTNTNKACAAVQTGCVTTGYGCVSTLSPCQSYTPTASTPCDGYQGSDGPCTLIGTGPNCSARTCPGASTTTVSGVVTTTNLGCQAWFPFISASLPGCVTNGTACVAAGTCSTLTQTSCTGYSTCSFTKSCVQNNLCSQYAPQSQCISNVGQFGRSCSWNGSCAPTACPTTATTDAICQGSGATATPGCYYQGQGTSCVDATTLGTDCTKFSGDNTFVANKGCYALYNNQCASTNSASSTVASCTARTCANFYQTPAATTQTSQCNTWLSGCLSNNSQGCVAASDDCTKYFGTQSQCNGFFGVNGTQQCYNTASATATTACVQKTFDLILQTTANKVWSDSECTAQLANTVSSQVGVATVGQVGGGVCVLKSKVCSDFTGPLATCNLVANLSSGKCTKSGGFCYNKTIAADCTTLTASSISACQTLQYNCTWITGTKCANVQACGSYTGTATSCNALTDGLGLRCGSNQSGSGACIYANLCTDYNTGASTTAQTYCATLKDAFGNTCGAVTNTDATCSYSGSGNKYALAIGQCSTPSLISGGVCTGIVASTTCASLSGPYFTSVANCKAALNTCTWGSGTTCVAISAQTVCTSYGLPQAAVPSSSAAGNTYCLQFSGAKGTCQYIGASPLAAKTCDEPVPCAGYTAVTTGQTLSAAVCALYTNATNKTCGYDGTNCVDPGASGACIAITAASVTLTLAQTCQATVEVGTPCSIPSGGKCGVPKTNCSDYLVTGLTATESTTLCQGYFTSPTQRCGYNGTATACQNRTCSDAGLTQSNCSTYLGSTCGWNATTSTCSTTRTCSDGGITSATCGTYLGNACAWNGTTCIAVSTVITCTMYAGGSLAACNLFFDNRGKQCGWSTGANCSDFQCSQIAAAGSATTHTGCQAINTACTASASAKTCVNIQTSCYKYTIGATVGDCTSMFDSQGIQCSNAGAANGQCTYSTAAASGLTTQATCLVNPAYTWTGSACTGTSTIVATCGGTTATGATFAAQLAYCQTLTSNALNGAPCFFTQYAVDGTLQTKCSDSVSAISTATAIAKPACAQANISNTPVGGSASAGNGADTDCAAFHPVCTATFSNAASGQTVTACTALTCGMASATVATSTAACQAFLSTCVWNGLTGCIKATDSTCASITGTVTTCATFAVNKIPCYQPVSTAITTATAAVCANVTCGNAPTTITTNAGCETWFPSSYATSYNATTNPGPNLSCVWTGTTGCTVPQSCSSFTGNATTCPTFVGNDGPCKAGTGSTCTPVLCADAPNSYNTDAQCAKFAYKDQQCLTNGYGCVAKASLSCTSIVNQTSCAASTLGGANTSICSWLSTCVSSVTSCTDSTLTNATLCTSTPVVGATCAWNPTTNACQNMTCALLPATLTTHATCSAALNTCTTTGSGCITLGTCASYTSAGQAACLAANNKEVSTSPQITKCIWANNACRVVQCTDNTTATADSACNVNGLTNCVTTGLGCVTKGAFTCTSLTTAAACLVDGSGSPCLWINGACQNYTACTSISWTTHSQCQRIIVSSGVTPTCTSNGSTCIAINACTNYTNAISCVTSNQKQTCGWLPANSKGNANAQCQVFGACTDAAGTTNAACALYGPSCISNGTSCIVQSNCASYTQYACNNNTGTDGTCFWQATSATVTVASCRTQQCGDVTAAYTAGSTTDAACALFPAPVINQCTTNGTTCVARSTCASYTTQLGCVLGTDGSCFWVPPAATAAAGTVGTCRVKACSDSVFTTSSLCATAIISTPAKTAIANGVTTTTPATNLACVSNGTACIPKSTCSSYVNQAACQGQGTDGACAFTPGTNATTPTIGTCALFSQCSSANSDSVACASLADRCFWSSTTTGTTTTTSCSPITCTQASSGTCKPIPSFNAATYSICGPVSSTNSTCISQDGSALPASICFSGTFKQYTWNDTAASCTYCSTVTTPNNTNNTNGTNGTTYGSIIASSFLIYGAILAIY